MVGTYQVIIDSTPSLKMRYLAAGRVRDFTPACGAKVFRILSISIISLTWLLVFGKMRRPKWGLRGGLLGEAQTYRDRDLLG